MPRGPVDKRDNPGPNAGRQMEIISHAFETLEEDVRDCLAEWDADAPGRAVVRMFPEDRHLNLGGSIHGGAVMSFIDMALFSGGFCAGMARGHYVTLDMSTRFIARGRSGVPLDAHIRLLKQTPGGLVFIDGHCEQDGAICYSFTGTLKKIKSRSDTGDEPRR